VRVLINSIQVSVVEGLIGGRGGGEIRREGKEKQTEEGAELRSTCSPKRISYVFRERKLGKSYEIPDGPPRYASSQGRREIIKRLNRKKEKNRANKQTPGSEVLNCTSLLIRYWKDEKITKRKGEGFRKGGGQV